ncbi:MAG TPA: hypothetical protein VIY72_05435 [Acidimicrobiales bacterium]
MVLALTAAVVVVILGAALVLSARIRARSRAQPVTDSAGAPLPAGAEAAIWSILEAVPDPRNHLALTRDLTGEVRIAGTPLDPAWRAANPTVDPWAAAVAWDDADERLSTTAA